MLSDRRQTVEPRAETDLPPPPRLDVRRNALFLDIDGTLLEIEEQPDRVRADEALRAVIRAAAERLGGALAILTGRSVIDADRVLGPDLAHVAGLHGLESRSGGQVRVHAVAPGFAEAAAQIRKLVETGALDVVLEDKQRGLALHYRRRPDQESLVRRLLEETAAAHGLQTVYGKMVAEIMPAGPNKGRALAGLMREPPFNGRVPVAVGDDVTDEEAFGAAAALGGYAILVGERRATKARYGLANAAAVRAWLKQAAAAS